MNIILRNIRQLVTVHAQGAPFKTGPSMQALHCLSRATVVVQNGIITWIGPDDEFQRSLFPDIDLFDASEYVVLPGFVDSLAFPFFMDSMDTLFKPWHESWTEGTVIQKLSALHEIMQHQSKAELKKEIRKHFETLFRHGTTTVQAVLLSPPSEYTHLLLLQILKELSNELLIDIVPAYYMLPEYTHPPDNYTQWLSKNFLPYLHERNTIKNILCDCTPDTSNFINTLHTLGFEAITLLNPTRTMNFTALMHLNTSLRYFLTSSPTSDDISLMLANNSFILLCPTFFLATHFPSFSLRPLVDAHVPIALGSWYHPFFIRTPSMQSILSLACTYFDLTPEEAITAATLNSAGAIGCATNVGSIELGKQADMVLIRGSSYYDLFWQAGTNHIQVIIKNGVLLEL